MTAILGAVLVGESLLTALWIAGHLTTLVVYDWIALVFIAARAIVAVFQFTAGAMLFRRRAMGPDFARGALAASAVLLIPELGFGLAPSSVFPDFRWPLVGAYWAYAAAAWSYLKFRKQD